MTKTLTVAIACVLGGFAFAAPAYAAGLVPVNGADRFLIPVADEETEAVEEDMRPDVKAPGPQDEEEAEGGAMEAMEPADEDVGEEEIERDMEKPEKN